MPLPLKIEYETDVRSEWRFRVRSGNHEIIAQGEGYKRLTDAQHAVELLAAGLRTATVEVLPKSGMSVLAQALARSSADQSRVNRFTAGLGRSHPLNRFR